MNILLVEDDPGIGRFISRGLQGRGYTVAWEREGGRATALLATGNFSAALLDLSLPDCDGLDICRALRRDRIGVPVLMLSARGTLQDRLDGFDCGADDYLPKPFAFEELVARLGVIIRRGAEVSPQPIVHGGLVIDLIDREASVGGKALSLPPREFALLRALASAGGEMVTRNDLLAETWGEDAEVSDNALDVYIGYLRRRLAGLPEAPRIETVRGRGFRLVNQQS